MTNGWHVKDSGCICRTFLVQKTFRSNSRNKTKSSFLSISSGKTQWWRPTKNLMYMNVAPVSNCWKSSKRTTSNFKKFKRKCKIILKLREQHSLDFISYQMISFFKFCLKQEIRMPSRPILESVLIILTESNLQMLNNREKLSLWFQLNHKQCHKLLDFLQVYLLKVQSNIGWWRFNKWWLSHFMTPQNKL